MAGKTIEFTRIMVGSGAMPEGVEPIDMVALVTPVAEGVSSVPTVENGVLSMVVEYRNDLNGGLQEGFWLREFGVFAKTEDTARDPCSTTTCWATTRSLDPMPTRTLPRLTFGSYPISVAARAGCRRPLPTTPARFITSAARLRSWWRGRWFRRRSAAVSAPPIIKGHHDSPYRLDAWREENPGEQGAWDMDEYRYYVDVPVTEAAETQFPNVALHKAALETAKNAGLCPTVQTLAGALRFWAKRSPDEDMEATVALVSPSALGWQKGRAEAHSICAARGCGSMARRRKIGKGISALLAAGGTITTHRPAASAPERHGPPTRRHGIHAGRSLPL
ncbi:MAG: hypothetical protein ACLUGP_07600 [Faecalibacterium prausnitzii]